MTMINEYLSCFSDEFQKNEGLSLMLRAIDEVYFALTKKKYIPEHTLLTESQNPKERLSFVWKNKKIILRRNNSLIFIVAFLDLSYLRKEIVHYFSITYPVLRQWMEDIDSVFLSRILGVDIPYLKSFEIESMKIENLSFYNPDTGNPVSINEERYYCQLINLERDVSINSLSSLSNHIFESNRQRLMASLQSVNNGFYKKRKYYGIVYNDGCMIKDGEHRLACLYFLQGNVEVPILRMKFSKNEYSYSLHYQSKGSRFRGHD